MLMMEISGTAAGRSKLLLYPIWMKPKRTVMSEGTKPQVTDSRIPFILQS